MGAGSSTRAEAGTSGSSRHASTSGNCARSIAPAATSVLAKRERLVPRQRAVLPQDRAERGGIVQHAVSVATRDCPAPSIPATTINGSAKTVTAERSVGPPMLAWRQQPPQMAIWPRKTGPCRKRRRGARRCPATAARPTLPGSAASSAPPPAPSAAWLAAASACRPAASAGAAAASGNVRGSSSGCIALRNRPGLCGRRAAFSHARRSAILAVSPRCRTVPAPGRPARTTRDTAPATRIPR